MYINTYTYIYTHIYYMIVKKPDSFLRNYDFSKKTNYLFRKYNFFIRINEYFGENFKMLRKYDLLVQNYFFC